MKGISNQGQERERGGGGVMTRDIPRKLGGTSKKQRESWVARTQTVDERCRCCKVDADRGRHGSNKQAKLGAQDAGEIARFSPPPPSTSIVPVNRREDNRHTTFMIGRSNITDPRPVSSSINIRVKRHGTLCTGDNRKGRYACTYYILDPS